METEKECRITNTIKILSLKWNLQIIKQLKDSKTKKRFSDLLIELKPISSRTLSKRLKELEDAGIVRKEFFKEIPPRTEYSLTKLGISCIKSLRPLFRWSEAIKLKNPKTFKKS